LLVLAVALVVEALIILSVKLPARQPAPEALAVGRSSTAVAR
jgi:hypothetical protein